MIKIRILILVFLNLICNIALSNTVIQYFSNASTFVVDGDNGVETLVLTGRNLQFCESSNFMLWASSNLVGKQHTFQNGTSYILVNSQWIPLDELLIRNGYLYNSEKWEIISVAASERRGEWNCAAKEAIFRLVLNDPDFALIIGAIAQNESKYKGYPWPWSINYKGKSMYFPSRISAYEYIQLLLKNGINNFDIGLTQINWKYHSHRFKSPWDALNPVINIKKSKEILVDLIKQHGNLPKAIACYHNCGNSDLGTKYFFRFKNEYDQLVALKGK